jgi:hypothetical protein
MSPSTANLSSVQRQAKRYSAHYRELVITYEGHEQEISVRPPDLSTQGMFIQTTRHFPEGAVLRVRFQLAHSQYQVTARAEVRYCLSGVGIGIEFIEISPEAQDAISVELRSEGDAKSK